MIQPRRVTEPDSRAIGCPVDNVDKLDKLANWFLAMAVFLAPWGSVGLVQVLTGRSPGFGVQPAILPLGLLVVITLSVFLRERRLRSGEMAVVVALIWTVVAAGTELESGRDGTRRRPTLGQVAQATSAMGLLRSGRALCGANGRASCRSDRGTCSLVRFARGLCSRRRHGNGRAACKQPHVSRHESIDRVGQ